MAAKTLAEAERERAALEPKTPLEVEGARMPSSGATIGPHRFSSALGRTGKGPDIYRTTGFDPTKVDGKPRAKP